MRNVTVMFSMTARDYPVRVRRMMDVMTFVAMVVRGLVLTTVVAIVFVFVLVKTIGKHGLLWKLVVMSNLQMITPIVIAVVTSLAELSVSSGPITRLLSARIKRMSRLARIRHVVVTMFIVVLLLSSYVYEMAPVGFTTLTRWEVVTKV